MSPADAQNDAAEIKLRAERRLGELTAEQEKHEGGRPTKTGHSTRPVSTPTYAEQGFTKQQAARWQEVARVPEEKFEDKVRLALIGKRMVEGSDGWEQKQQRAREETARAKAEGGRKGGAASGATRRGEASASREANASRDHAAEDRRKTASRLAAEVGVSRATVERARRGEEDAA